MNNLETLSRIREFEAFMDDPGCSSKRVCDLPIKEESPRKQGIKIGTLRFDAKSGEITVSLKPLSNSKTPSVQSNSK